jgi:hypothetical protein
MQRRNFIGLAIFLALVPAAPARAKRIDTKRAAQELIDKAIQAHGGAEKVRAVKLVYTEAEGTLPAAAAGKKTIMTAWVGQDRIRAEVTTLDGKKTVFVLGASDGWLQQSGPPQELPAAQRELLLDSAWREFIWLRALDPKTTVAWAPPETIDGTELPAVVLVRADGRPPITVLFDPKTHLIAMKRYRGPKGEEVIDIPSDYRAVGGVMFPFRTRVERDGKLSSEVTMTKILLNGDAPATSYDKPAK